jgi:hypothetical protein
MAIRRSDLSSVPESWPNEDEHRRKIAIAVNELLRSQAVEAEDFETVTRLENVTLTASATSTTVSHASISSSSAISLVPATASAAAALASIWIEYAAGAATLHHDASAATDRRFVALLFG